MKPEDILHIFEKRHSCRAFSDEPVPVKSIGIICQAGLMAPCAMGKHASHLFVFKRGEDDYNTLIQLSKDDNGRNPFYSAPVIILECLDRNSVHMTRDGGAVIENILLAASMLDLGACWIHAPSVIFGNNPKLLKRIGIPTDYVVVGGISLGNKPDHKGQLKAK